MHPGDDVRCAEDNLGTRAARTKSEVLHRTMPLRLPAQVSAMNQSAGPGNNINQKNMWDYFADRTNLPDSPVCSKLGTLRHQRSLCENR